MIPSHLPIQRAVAYEPELYPLSKPMMSRLQELYEFPSEHAFSPSLEEQIQHLRNHFAAIWHPLLLEVEALRERATEAVAPKLVKKLPITTEDFIELLYRYTPTPKKTEMEPITPKTISKWRGKGWLRDNGRNDLSIETVIAVLIMRMADSRREKGFIPPQTRVDEPYMYVWRVDRPGELSIPCGLPLADDLPRHAFLYTRWQLLSVLHPDDWFQYANGSVRWAHTKEVNGQVYWDVTEDDLRVWEPHLEQFSTYIGAPLLDTVPMMRQTVANLVLLRLAQQAFVPSPGLS